MFKNLNMFFLSHYRQIMLVLVICVSILGFAYYLNNGLGLAYNDARSHLDIGRRVVEGLKTGLAQIGSVWLPLPHLLMIPTIWNDFMWHSGLSGSLPSMISYVLTTMIIMAFLRRLGIGIIGQIVGGLVFALNTNVLYLQSIAMTELLLMGTMTAAAYGLLLYYQTDKLLYLIVTAIFVMLASLTRYDGWFLCMYIAGLVMVKAWKTGGGEEAQGMTLFFLTLGGFGIVLWVMWNWVIFHDPLYFMSGPYSARAQQIVLENAGMLKTKGDWLFSLFTYTYDTVLSIGIVQLILATWGWVTLMLDKRLSMIVRLATTTLLVPFMFNVISLYLGQSAIFLQGISAESWFNVRYGVLSVPGVAIFIGYLIDKYSSYKTVIITALFIVTAVSFTSGDTLAIDDALVGSSQKNVTEVSTWLKENVPKEEGFVMISTAAHDAILFSSGLPMKRFIHEGTGKYWENSGRAPDRWAKWLIMRTNDVADATFALTKASGQLYKYDLISAYPFADIYKLKEEYYPDLNTTPVIGKQK